MIDNEDAFFIKCEIERNKNLFSTALKKLNALETYDNLNLAAKHNALYETLVELIDLIKQEIDDHCSSVNDLDKVLELFIDDEECQFNKQNAQACHQVYAYYQDLQKLDALINDDASNPFILSEFVGNLSTLLDESEHSSVLETHIGKNSEELASYIQTKICNDVINNPAILVKELKKNPEFKKILRDVASAYTYEARYDRIILLLNEISIAYPSVDLSQLNPVFFEQIVGKHEAHTYYNIFDFVQAVDHTQLLTEADNEDALFNLMKYLATMPITNDDENYILKNKIGMNQSELRADVSSQLQQKITQNPAFEDILNSLNSHDNYQNLQQADKFTNLFNLIKSFVELIEVEYGLKDLSRLEMQALLKCVLSKYKANEISEVYHFYDRINKLSIKLEDKNAHSFELLELYADIKTTIENDNCSEIMQTVLHLTPKKLWDTIKNKLLTLSIVQSEDEDKDNDNHYNAACPPAAVSMKVQNIEKNLAFKLNKTFSRILHAIVTFESNPIDLLFALDKFHTTLSKEYKIYKNDASAEIDSVFRGFLLKALIEESDSIKLDPTVKTQLNNLSDTLSAAYHKFSRLKSKYKNNLADAKSNNDQILQEIIKLKNTNFSKNALRLLQERITNNQLLIASVESELKQISQLDDFLSTGMLNKKDFSHKKQTFDSLLILPNIINSLVTTPEVEEEEENNIENNNLIFIEDNPQDHIEPIFNYLNISLGLAKYQDRREFERWGLDILSKICVFFIRYNLRGGISNNHPLAHIVIDATKKCLLDFDTPVIQLYATLINILRMVNKKKGDLVDIINNDLLPQVEDIIPIVEKEHSLTFAALAECETQHQLKGDELAKEKNRIEAEIDKTPTNIINYYRKEYLLTFLPAEDFKELYDEQNNSSDLKCLDPHLYFEIYNKFDGIFTRLKQWFYNLTHPNEVVNLLIEANFKPKGRYTLPKNKKDLLSSKVAIPVSHRIAAACA